MINCNGEVMIASNCCGLMEVWLWTCSGDYQLQGERKRERERKKKKVNMRKKQGQNRHYTVLLLWYIYNYRQKEYSMLLPASKETPVRRRIEEQRSVFEASASSEEGL
jgi:uncharacterized protein YrzB (UPF0473 family)